MNTQKELQKLFSTLSTIYMERKGETMKEHTYKSWIVVGIIVSSILLGIMLERFYDRVAEIIFTQ